MKFKQPRNETNRSVSEFWSETAILGGDKKCRHVWVEPIEKVWYHGIAPDGFNTYGANTTGTRCLSCGQVSVYISASRKLSPVGDC